MRRPTAVAAVALAAFLLPGCGWKMAESPIRVSGRVIDAGTREPVGNACIDVSDDREELDIRLDTGVRTGEDGAFDTVFAYSYERWMWFGVPVWWLPRAPERIFVEVSGSGYRTRVTHLEYRAALTGKEKELPPAAFEPIALHRSSPSKRGAARRAE